MSIITWFRSAFARSDAISLIDAKLDNHARLLVQAFTAIIKRQDRLIRTLEGMDMTSETEQLLLDVRALMANMSPPSALAESQAAVAHLTADLTAANADLAQMHAVVTQTTADAMVLASDNARLVAELEGVKATCAPFVPAPIDPPEGAPV